MRLSVCMITYDQERYLGAAIESALVQQGDFELRVVIGVDVSSDRTLEVARSYERRYPDRVRVLSHSRRIGMMPNFLSTFAECADADYVALLEGDDRWTCTTKLEQQVEYMEANPGCAICCHDVSIRYEEPERVVSAPRNPQQLQWPLEGLLTEDHQVY